MNIAISSKEEKPDYPKWMTPVMYDIFKKQWKEGKQISYSCAYLRQTFGIDKSPSSLGAICRKNRKDFPKRYGSYA